MFAAIGMMACPNLAVPAEVMRHIVDVESGSNPYAIGVVGGQLVRQPKNLGEALATVHMLDAKGYNYSLGIAQVNRANLGKYGLDSYEKAFEACPNLAAGAQILAACYAGSGGDWGKAFSCYYSGNFVTGYRDGYVQKVYESINRSAGLAAADGSRAIPLKATAPPVVPADTAKATKLAPGSAGYRVAIRSVAFYTTTTSAVPASDTVSGPAQASADPLTQGPPKPVMPAMATTSQRAPVPAPKPSGSNAPAAASVAESTVFVPQVSGPNDPTSRPAGGHVAPTQVASAGPGSTDAPIVHGKELHDAAFVF